MQNTMTPPTATRSRRSSASSFEEADIDAYISKTYVPLSNLPTPPLSSHSLTNPLSSFPQEFLVSGEILNPDLLGPAIHLTNLIITSTSLTAPSVPLVHTMLTRAALPLETLALSVAILDSLNSRFALTWRQGCPLAPNQHVDSIHPEILVLAALVLAVKFLDDQPYFTRMYSGGWGRALWSCEQVNFTQRCILENLGYRLLPLWEESIISEALEDMERAARQASSEDVDWDTDTCCGSFGGEQHLGGGKAVLGLENQLTPAETPMEGVRGTRDLPLETKRAFQSSLQGRFGTHMEQFQLPNQSRESSEEDLTVDVDPMMEKMAFGR